MKVQVGSASQYTVMDNPMNPFLGLDNKVETNIHFLALSRQVEMKSWLTIVYWYITVLYSTIKKITLKAKEL